MLAETLAIAHPVIPFVTEEIWSHVPGAEGLLMAPRWPAADESLIDADAEAEVGRAIAAVQALRGWRDGIGAAPAAVLPARLEAEGYERTAALRRAARAARVVAGRRRAGRDRRGARRRVAVLASDAVDLGAAARRIEERRGWLDAEIARAEQKLANEGFVAKAPEAVVAGRARQARRPARGARRAVTPDRPSEAAGRGRARSTCSGSSCSACASGWSACAGC